MKQQDAAKLALISLAFQWLKNNPPTPAKRQQKQPSNDAKRVIDGDYCEVIEDEIRDAGNGRFRSIYRQLPTLWGTALPKTAERSQARFLLRPVSHQSLVGTKTN